MIGHGEQVTFAPAVFHLLPVPPHFLKCTLHNILSISLVPQVFKHKAIHIIGVAFYTFIVFFFRHTAVVAGFLVWLI
jgi:hypothetical protein